MKICPNCRCRVPDNHRCNQSTLQDSSGDFLTSAAIGFATDSALLGTVLGGDPLGAVIGDMLNTSDSGIGDAVSSLFD